MNDLSSPTSHWSLQEILDAAGDAMYGVDAEGRITFVNRALLELLGVPGEVLAGQVHHLALGHPAGPGSPERGSADACAACDAIGPGRPAHGELLLDRPGKAPLPVAYAARPVGTDGSRGAVVTLHDLSERQAMEERQRQAQAEVGQLVSVVEASPNLVVVGRSDGRVQWLNSSGRALLGIGPDEDAGTLVIEDIFEPEELARVFAEDMPALLRAGHWQGDRVLRSRTGELIPVAVASRLHVDETFPEGYYVTEIMRDLRPQLEQERNLRLSENRLSTAETIAGMGSWEWDLDKDHVQWSRGLYQLYGMTGDGVESLETWLSTVHPEDQQRVRDICTRVAEGRGGLDFVCRSSRADGTQMVIHSRGGIVDEAGAPRVIVGTLLDITEQHAALAAVQRSQELTRRILQSAGDAYVQFCADGRVTEWNAQAEKIFGRDREEALGQPLVSLVTGRDRREALAALLGLGGGPGTAGVPTEHFEQPMLHRSGREFPAEVTAWTTDDGEQRVFSCVIRDVSERRAAERAKNEFVSVVGHELRTPLTSIHGALGLLRAGLLGELNPRGKQMVEIAAHNTDRLVRLINDILDIERLNSGKVDLTLQDCDVAVLAERSLEVMRSMADRAGVRLTLDAPPAAHRVDPDRIEQTLTNLLSNAIKFSPAGSEVMLSVRADADDLTVQVRDQGRGIPEADLERIFDRFQQVDGSDARDKGGTGLGLAICRTIVEQHGGRIRAESPPGGGAVLTLTIPAAPAPSPAVAASPLPLSPAAEPAAASLDHASDEEDVPAGPKVLVCSAESSVRERITDVLRSRGYDPVQVAGGTLLLEAALLHRPAVILFEQRTPAVANWEAAMGLHARPETHDVPVVFLSFDGDQVFAESDDLATADEPMDLGGLVEAVRTVIDKHDKGPELLLVEDDDGLATVLAERFRRLGVRVHRAATARQALDACSRIVPDLVVLDLQLPDQDGFAVVAQLRQHPRLRGTPLAVYSARDVDEPDRKRLRLGKTGFFTKGRVNPDEFELHVMDLLGHLTNTSKEISRG